MANGKHIAAPDVTEAQIMEYLNEVMDPEVPVISLVELGVVRRVEVAGSKLIISLTPTYSGCPAMHMMQQDIRATLRAKGFRKVEIKTVFSPAWTTDWMSAETKAKLKDYGIAPPDKVRAADLDPFSRRLQLVPCPLCNSKSTRRTSEFGSTACKALYYCDGCHQPFEHFKCI